ncbi:cytochrome P450 [Dendrothele bispora CBS 962.96]|uniref:Cytochrome P450 n=1 Tax=Dendrothele bispora (strain CBS 962.96) TaxID=1314807 RepID=A0A4S8LD71_DENBC|nr:cytochrome P450 [Dendrothele bispora CBS 962.96]
MVSMVSALLLAGIMVVLHLYKKKSSICYPPGPPGLPLLGNLFQLETVKPWHTFSKWKEIYGPIVFLKVLGQPIVILNSKRTVEDLLEHRSHKYSGRPRSIIANIVTGNMAIVLRNTDERWRRMRRAAENALGINASTNYYQLQTVESILLAHGILSQPKTWKAQVERASSSAILSLVYGHPPLESLDDPSTVFMKQFGSAFLESTMPASSWVEVFPFLERLPFQLSGWHRDAKKKFTTFNSKFQQLFADIRNQVDKGYEQTPSFCATLAEGRHVHHMSDQECSWLAGMLHFAGQETTTNEMRWFILAMVSFPEAQQHAQDQLDQIVGRSRLPSFSDLKHLPYVRAIVKEILRWRPSAPIGAPHVAAEDDYYNGYFIPKGTICISNIWLMNHDREVYGPDADSFIPERHLDKQGNLKDEHSDGHHAFGSGQSNHLMGNETRTSKGFQISNGKSIKLDLDLEDDDGLVVRPPPFPIAATPRFPDAEVLLQQTRDDINKEFLPQYVQQE